MQLFKVLDGVNEKELEREYLNLDIVGIAYDSRKVQKGFIFVCLVGFDVDGHKFAISAYKNGCRVFVVEKEIDLPTDSVQILVKNSRVALSKISANFFSHPSRQLKVIGVTGTKGKTTVTHMVSQVLNSCGINCGTIGTNGIYYNKMRYPTVNTTPESFELQKVFSNMIKAGVEAVCMEVSSQGIMMHRTDDVDFDIGIFTNLSPDHIGEKEHPDFEDYASCKAKLFENCKVGFFNLDDEHFDFMAKNATCETNSFSIYKNADFYAQNIQPMFDDESFGISFKANTQKGDFDVKLNMLGNFSVYNALACICVGQYFNIPNQLISQSISNALVDGRCEVININDFKVIIDFAHNKASLEAILSELTKYEYNRLICLFGSVGGRSVMRRKELGEVGSKYCDYLVLTSDNPDFEDPINICDDITKGFIRSVKYEIIPDRKEAIDFILENARAKDIILLAGKGHEDYQLICGQKIEFSERDIINNFIKTKELF